MGGILYTLAVILIILWVIGFLVAHVVSPSNSSGLGGGSDRIGVSVSVWAPPRIA